MGIRIAEIDRNLAVNTVCAETDVQWISVQDEPFDMYGLYNPQQPLPYRRMPGSVAERINPGVFKMYTCTAGGRIRFRTNSPYVALHAQINTVCRMPHMPLAGSAGFDLYEMRDTDVYIGTFMPPADMQNGYTSVYRFASQCMRDVTINMPLYSGVDRLLIGVSKDSMLEKHGKPYANGYPIVYYGSSITQGGCASRPGNAYPSMISRRLNRDYINLGFSGSAAGGQVIAEYLAGLKMKLFVCDYDHNAQTPEQLAETHEPLYRTFREKQPDTPILFMSRPDTDKCPDTARRFKDVILATLQHAINAGDRMVCFVDGEPLFGLNGRDACTVDTTHPNDLGFFRMAEGALNAMVPLLG